MDEIYETGSEVLFMFYNTFYLLIYKKSQNANFSEKNVFVKLNIGKN